MLPLPKTLGEDTPRLILCVQGGFDPNEYKIEELLKVWFMIMDLMMIEDDHMIVVGQLNVMDLKKSTLAHFTMFNPTMLKKLTMQMQEGDFSGVRARPEHFH